MYPWRSVVRIKKSAKPIYLQVADAVIREISNGRLAAGQKLPGARELSKLLGLNRKTVVAAMTELNSQGWIESYQWRGTFVSKKLPKMEQRSLQDIELMLSTNMKEVEVNTLPGLESLHLDVSGKILIDDGVPDVRLAPLKLLFAYHRSFLAKKTFSKLLKYNHVQGEIDLRVTLTKYLQHTRGIVTSPENIFLTRGSQMGIYLAIGTLLRKGDICITSLPGYQVVDKIIGYFGGKVGHVPVDSEGLVVDEVEKLCKRKKIKLLYTTSHHHYPTTVTLSPSRRIKLLQLAFKYNFYILEDDYAYDFQYDNNPVLPLASLNKNDQIIYIGSFSKCLSPLVRIGYFVGPREMMEAANKLRRIIDRQGDPLLERAMSEFIKNGDLQRHLKKVVKVYRQRRDHFTSLLSSLLGDQITFIRPEGGMSVWITFKRSIKNLPEKLSDMGYLLDSDIEFINQFNSVRIGFASLDEKEMKLFAAALKKATI